MEELIERLKRIANDANFAIGFLEAKNESIAESEHCKDCITGIYWNGEYVPSTNLNSLIQSNAEIVQTQSKEEEELKRIIERIMKIDNVRQRSDGRFEWRKTIEGIPHQVIDKDPQVFLKKLNAYKKQLRQKGNTINKSDIALRRPLVNLCRIYYERYIKNEIKSHSDYLSAINKHLACLDRSIETYTKGYIVDHIKNIQSKKQAKISFYLLRKVFEEEQENGTIKVNFLNSIKPPETKSEKGLWFNLAEQKLIIENWHKLEIRNEIEFFLLSGCRLSEAFNCQLDVSNCRLFVSRTKKDGTSGYVKLSKQYTVFLEKNWDLMFKKPRREYAKIFRAFLSDLGIKKQSNEKPIHRLRHTYATNIYYLGAKDSKQRAYLLGHKSSKVTDDIYTDFDPAIKKKDIVNIYSGKYPKF